MKKQITILHMCVHMHIYSTAHTCTSVCGMCEHECIAEASMYAAKR